MPAFGEKDNAQVHISVIGITIINELKFVLLPHIPCSPDLAPSDCIFFPNLKKLLRGVLTNNEEDSEAVEYR